MTVSRLPNCLRRAHRQLGAAVGALILLTSGQVFASTVVLAPAAAHIRRASAVVKPAPGTYVAVAPLPTVVVKPAPPTRTVHVVAHPVYVVR